MFCYGGLGKVAKTSEPLVNIVSGELPGPILILAWLLQRARRVFVTKPHPEPVSKHDPRLASGCMFSNKSYRFRSSLGLCRRQGRCLLQTRSEKVSKHDPPLASGLVFSVKVADVDCRSAFVEGKVGFYHKTRSGKVSTHGPCLASGCVFCSKSSRFRFKKAFRT